MIRGLQEWSRERQAAQSFPPRHHLTPPSPTPTSTATQTPTPLPTPIPTSTQPLSCRHCQLIDPLDRLESWNSRILVRLADILFASLRSDLHTICVLWRSERQTRALLQHQVNEAERRQEEFMRVDSAVHSMKLREERQRQEMLEVAEQVKRTQHELQRLEAERETERERNELEKRRLTSILQEAETKFAWMEDQQRKLVRDKEVEEVKLQQRAMDLQRELERQRQALLLHQEQSIKCDLCFDLQKDTVFLPCGHTGCDSCYRRLVQPTNICPFCSKRIDSVSRIFLT